MSKTVNSKELEVSEALNSLTTANLRGAVGDSALTQLIKDYFCSGDQSDASDASSDSDSGDEDVDGDGTGELPDTTEKQPESEDDRESVAVDDFPIVTVDVVSSELYITGGGGETVCDAEDKEMERVKKFMCACSKSCYLHLTHEKILKRRLDMKELTEGNMTLLIIKDDVFSGKFF